MASHTATKTMIESFNNAIFESRGAAPAGSKYPGVSAYYFRATTATAAGIAKRGLTVTHLEGDRYFGQWVESVSDADLAARDASLSAAVVS